MQNCYHWSMVLISCGIWGLIKEFLCCFDAEDVVQVLSTQSIPSVHQYREIILRIQSLLQKDWMVHLEYVPRDYNLIADALAKKVALEDHALKIWKTPQDLLPIIMHDVI